MTINMSQAALPAPRNAPAQDFRPMTLRRLLRPLLDNWKLIGLGALVPLVVVYILALMLPTTYSATSSILVEERQIDLGDIEQVVAPSVRDAATVASQIEIVLSDPVLEAAARNIGRLDGDEVATEALIETLDGLRAQLEVSRRLNSLVVDVTAHARSPEGAAQVANAVAEAYLAEQVVAKQEVADSALTWMEGQIGELRTRISGINGRINDVRRATLDSDQGDPTALEEQITQIGEQISEALVAQANAEARYATLARVFSQAGVMAAAELLSSSEIDRQVSIRAQLVLDRETELVKRGARHPAVEALAARIGAIDSSLGLQVQAAVDASGAEAEGAKERVSALRRASNGLQAQAIDLADTLQNLQELEQELEANEGLYLAFLARFNEIASQSLALTTDARILGVALPPSGASGPRRLLLAFMAAFLGGCGAIGFVLLREALSDRFEGLEELEIETGIPIVELSPADQLMAGADTHQEEDPLAAEGGLVLSSVDASAATPVIGLVFLNDTERGQHGVEVARSLGRFRGKGEVKIIEVVESGGPMLTGAEGERLVVVSAPAEEIIDPAARRGWSERLAADVAKYALVVLVPPAPGNGSLSALWASLADVSLLATSDPRPSRQAVHSIASRISGWGGKVGGLLILSR